MWRDSALARPTSRNFIGSVRQRNWPRYTDEASDHYMTNSSSVMNYTTYYAE